MYIPIKPMSVNECWQGQRFKSPAYKKYEELMMARLPYQEIPDGKLSLFIEFGFSNIGCDIDNPLKPLFDILQKKYGFNDKNIYECSIRKKIVKKGKEYIFIKFSKLQGTE